MCKVSWSSRQVARNAFAEQRAQAQRSQACSPNSLAIDVEGPQTCGKVVAEKAEHREAFSLTHKRAHSFGRIAWKRDRRRPRGELQAPKTGRTMKVGLETLPEEHELSFYRVHPLTFHTNVFVGCCEDLGEQELFGVGREVYSGSERVSQTRALKLDLSARATANASRPQKEAITQQTAQKDLGEEDMSAIGHELHSGSTRVPQAKPWIWTCPLGLP